MTGPERRQTPRTTLDKHAYINIEPDNGGIVLNVSEGGLCFHSFDPLPKNGKVRFWFSDNGQRIEADGTVAWADETQKGGLRFTALGPEARERICDWMSHPATPLVGGARAAAADPQPRAFAAPQRPDITAVPGSSTSPAMVSMKAPVPLSGFSRGLATGLLVSAVVVAAFIFQTYRREFGETLIHLGERFAANPQTQTLTVSAAAPAELPLPRIASSVPPPTTPAKSSTPQAMSPSKQAELPAPAPIPALRSEKVAPPPEKSAARPEKLPPPAEKADARPLTVSTKPQPAKVEPATPFSVAPTAASGPTLTPAPPAPAMSFTPVPVTLPNTGPATGSAPSPGGLSSAPKLEATNQPGVHTEGSGAVNTDFNRELYFEVGKFKNVFQAQDETEKLAQLGFRATAVQKGHLWANSFHVLVGPYPDEEQAKATHENLVTSGFKPRPFEKGWRSFTFISSVTLNGSRTPEGDYTISWESYIGDASVKFLRNNSVVTTTEGRWVKREAKYPRDAYVYRRNPDGSRTLLEIHFGGMRQALVFGKPS